MDDAISIDPNVRLGIEIGFGMGDALVEWATRAPAWRLYGIDLYQPGIAALADRLHRSGLTNVRILEQPAQLALAGVAPGSIHEVCIYFPDPWPKQRHFKRRLVQPDFVAALAQALSNGGVVRLATDWTPYADWMRACFGECPEFVNTLDTIRQPGACVSTARPTTKFERRGERLGHPIHDLVYLRR